MSVKTMTFDEHEIMSQLDRAYPDVSILTVLPGRGWKAVVADEDARGHLIQVKHLALVQPVGEDEQCRVVPVIELEGTPTLHGGVVALIADVEDGEMGGLEREVWGACDPTVNAARG